jgi:hypothetical protein
VGFDFGHGIVNGLTGPSLPFVGTPNLFEDGYFRLFSKLVFAFSFLSICTVIIYEWDGYFSNGKKLINRVKALPVDNQVRQLSYKFHFLCCISCHRIFNKIDFT